jgi:hypothetical protein
VVFKQLNFEMIIAHGDRSPPPAPAYHAQPLVSARALIALSACCRIFMMTLAGTIQMTCEHLPWTWLPDFTPVTSPSSFFKGLEDISRQTPPGPHILEADRRAPSLPTCFPGYRSNKNRVGFTKTAMLEKVPVPAAEGRPAHLVLGSE